MVLKQSWLFGLWLGLSMFSGQHDLKARPLPQSHRTYQTAYAVFVNVAYSFGDGRGIPKFEIIAKGKKKNPLISRYFPSPVPTVQMSEEVVAMCLTSGADSLNALAFILGHELAHHFKRHALLGMGDSNTKSIDVQESRKLEGEADYFGCFYAQIAGYQPVSAGISILDKIYKAYDLENQERGYPPLEDRQETLVKVKKMIAPLTSVFQAGQLLYVRGNYEVAYICFEYLVDRFPSRELYSNLGCAYLQAYLHQFPSDQQGFIYPLEFDARTRLEKPVPVRVRGQP
ncbi:MAG TPA: hypothetical protein VGN64_15610, partial [Dyadobacter sp.]|nr:hypothetical protein [Dyadobacter sp.]